MDQIEGRQFSAHEQEGEEHSTKRKRRSRSMIVVKLLLIPFLLFISLVVGLSIGYTVMGKQPISEVFNVQTYKHMYDLIFAGK